MAGKIDSFMKFYYVYIVCCSDGQYYCGITNDVERRVSEHNLGLSPTSFTFQRRPVQLAYSAEFKNVDEAIAWEKRVKRWSRMKKEALIHGEFDKLIALATCKNITKELGNRILRRIRYGIRHSVSVMVRPFVPAHGRRRSP